MGFLVWAGLSLLAFGAGFALVERFGAHLAGAERVAGAALLGLALVLGPMQAVGYAGLFTPLAIALAVALCSGVALVVSQRRPGELTGAAADLLVEAVELVWHPVALPVFAATSALVAGLGLLVHLLPSWGWDAVWYHDAISAYAFQEQTLGWVDCHIPFVNSYPKHIELLAAWNVLFLPDDRWIDAVQLPLLLLGVLSLGALCRRAGLDAPLALAVGCGWAWMPAVFLNAPSNYVDVAAAGLWIATTLFAVRSDATPFTRLLAAVGMGLCAGSKVSGLMYALMVVPFLLATAWRDARGRGGLQRVALEGLLLASTVLALGGATYVRNVVRFGNPFWPAQVPIPLGGGRTFPGTWPLTNFNVPPFGGGDDLSALWRSFNEMSPFWFVDVRLGGFGWVWLQVLLPACAVALLLALGRAAMKRPTPMVMAALSLGLTALATPAKWWPRYTLGFPAAGLLAFALVVAHLPRHVLRAVAVAALALALGVQAWPARSGFKVTMEELREVWRADGPARAAHTVDKWQGLVHPIRDSAIRPGEAAAYDDASSFIYGLWRSDWQSRVVRLPFEPGNAEGWLKRLDAERVRVAVVADGSPANGLLTERGWQPLGHQPNDSASVFLRRGGMP